MFEEKSKPSKSSHESPAPLPGILTSIIPQKKQTTRFSLFVDGLFLIGISADTLLTSGLSKGDTLTPNLYENLLQSEQSANIKNYLLTLIGNREHATQELLTKAIKKGFPSENIKKIITQFEINGWVDNNRFAKLFIADKYRLQKWGPLKIKQALQKKGISRNIYEPLLLKISSDNELGKQCKFLVLKRKARFLRETDLMKRKQKILFYLSSKGYPPDCIFSVIDEILAELT